MPLQLVGFDGNPKLIAATKTGFIAPDGRFFLDFSRKLDVIRWCGVRNRFICPAVALIVPVVHERESTGGYVFSLNAGEPYFLDLRKLWKTHFPSKPVDTSHEADGLKIIADFAAHFPEDV